MYQEKNQERINANNFDHSEADYEIEVTQIENEVPQCKDGRLRNPISVGQ